MSDTYVYPELGPEYELRSWDADRLMRWCTRDLYLPEQLIRWHGPAVKPLPGQMWMDAAGSARYSVNSEKLAGWVERDRPGIAVVVRQSETEMLRTVGHEMYHRYEIREGRDPLDHARAEAYGRRVADDYLARRIP